MRLVEGVNVVTWYVGCWCRMTGRRLVGWWCTIHVEAGGDGRVVHVGRLGWCHVVA